MNNNIMRFIKIISIAIFTLILGVGVGTKVDEAQAGWVP